MWLPVGIDLAARHENLVLPVAVDIRGVDIDAGLVGAAQKTEILPEFSMQHSFSEKSRTLRSIKGYNAVCVIQNEDLLSLVSVELREAETRFDQLSQMQTAMARWTFSLRRGAAS